MLAKVVDDGGSRGQPPFNDNRRDYCERESISITTNNGPTRPTSATDRVSDWMCRVFSFRSALTSKLKTKGGASYRFISFFAISSYKPIAVLFTVSLIFCHWLLHIYSSLWLPKCLSCPPNDRVPVPYLSRRRDSTSFDDNWRRSDSIGRFIFKHLTWHCSVGFRHKKKPQWVNFFIRNTE